LGVYINLYIYTLWVLILEVENYYIETKVNDLMKKGHQYIKKELNIRMSNV
jgi:hypothetical protein